MGSDSFRLARFRAEDQAAVRELILAGLEEHWGQIDPSLNPDLDDFATAYGAGTTILAWSGDTIVGTGTVMPRAATSSEVVRMSVARDHRRRGIGRLILDALVAAAAESGAQRVILETTAAWDDAVTFYRSFGFAVTHTEDGQFGTDIYFSLDVATGESGTR
jgi:GNAT superfamily N-acetyltransferase